MTHRIYAMIQHLPGIGRLREPVIFAGELLALLLAVALGLLALELAPVIDGLLGGAP